MGIFSKFKEAMQQNKETDIEKMEFVHCTGFLGSAGQKFCDVTVPVCPECKQNSSWAIHMAQKTLKFFPVPEEEYLYHMKCEHCGAILHVTLNAKNGDMPYIFSNPSPNVTDTMITVDVSKDANLAGKTMPIAELNKLAQSK